MNNMDVRQFTISMTSSCQHIPDELDCEICTNVQQTNKLLFLGKREAHKCKYVNKYVMDY